MSGSRVRALLHAAMLVAAGCTRSSSDMPASTTPGTANVVSAGNHLVSEKSPYLVRHAHNPVDWYPWGTEAFDKAHREHKLIFLSIGYSTCHWCHVMEEESFTNPAIAAAMNQHFVSIKVDREERPDIDRVYLAYVTSVSSGGWPMSVVLTPDLKPFFGATYLPPETRDGQEGLHPLLERLAAAWTDDPQRVLKAAADGTSIVTTVARIPAPADALPGVRELDETYANLKRSFDRAHGGFGGAPKFPRPVVLGFLFRQYARTGDHEALDMAITTLRAMARGAIHDRLDGGFHRYTVDAGWQVPHFEKMLYDQAQLGAAYVEAYQASRDPELAAIARNTLDYVLRQLRDAGGGFYSAEDADSRVAANDSHLAEGAFYVWTLAELQRVLGSDAPLAAYHFGVTAAGNLGVDDNAIGAGENALGERHSIRDTASRFHLTERAVQSRLDHALAQLRDARGTRPRPARDEKIIAAWNGLMISALARAHMALDDRRYLDGALGAARFVETRLLTPSASLQRRFIGGSADIDGLPDDYAFFIQGLLDLFEASSDPHWLSLALKLQATQDRLFWDESDGAYFSTRADAAHVLARMKEDYDGAEPAANSVAAVNLVRLWHVTANDTWRTRADATFRAMSGRVARSGTAVPQLMAALDLRQGKAKQIVIAGDPSSADTHVLLRLVHGRFIPNKTVAVVDGGPRQAELGTMAPPLAEMPRRAGRATIYVCENYTCHLPTSDPSVAARLLDGQPR